MGIEGMLLTDGPEASTGYISFVRYVSNVMADKRACAVLILLGIFSRSSNTNIDDFRGR